MEFRVDGIHFEGLDDFLSFHHVNLVGGFFPPIRGENEKLFELPPPGRNFPGCTRYWE